MMSRHYIIVIVDTIILKLGRWLNAEDVSYLDPELINGLNLFAYCYNDQISYVDSSGRFFIAFIIGFAIGYYVGSQTVRNTQYINENYSGSAKTWLMISNFTLGVGITSMFAFDKNKNFNVFSALQYSLALKEKGLPDNRTTGGIFVELIAHHVINTFDIFDFVDNDDVADMGNFNNDSNAKIWEIISRLLFG